MSCYISSKNRIAELIFFLKNNKREKKSVDANIFSKFGFPLSPSYLIEPSKDYYATTAFPDHSFLPI